MKPLSRVQRVKNRTKKIISSVKNLISKKYIYIVGWGGVFFSSGLNRFVTLEDSHPSMASNQVIESVKYGCLCSQLGNKFDLQDQDQLQIQTGSGVTLTAYKNIQSFHEDKKVVLAKSPDKPFFPGANAFPVNPPASRPGRRTNSGTRINPPGYRIAPKVLPNPQEQQQAGNKIKNKENSGEPDKGSGSNFPEYENTCPSQSSSNNQKPEITHGEHIPGEVRPKKISSIIDADSGLIRLAEQACNNQKVQDSINHLQEELAKGNNNPGIHKKYLRNNIWEHRALKGGRLYTREIGDKVVILAKSGKGTQN